MKLERFFILFGTLIFMTGLVSGCITLPEYSRDDWLRAQNHSYSDIPVESIIAAAERVFRLSDDKDYNFSYTYDGLIARRDWTIYAVLSWTKGLDTWRLTTQTNGDEVKLFVELETLETYFGGYNRKYGPQFTSIYELLWDRMDYLLGLREDWVTCADYFKNYETMHGLGHGLCAATSHNITPWGEPENVPPDISSTPKSQVWIP